MVLPYWQLEQPASGFWTLQTLQNLALDCGLWALCQTVGAVAQTAGSGLWRAKSFFSSGPKLPFKPLKRLKPLKPPETCQWFCHTGSWSSQLLDSGRFRRSKTSHLLDCGLWALARQILFSMGLACARQAYSGSSARAQPCCRRKPGLRFAMAALCAHLRLFACLTNTVIASTCSRPCIVKAASSPRDVANALCRVRAFPSPRRVSGRRLLLFAFGTLPFFAILGPQPRPIHGFSSPEAKQQVSPQLRSFLERRRVEGAVNRQTLPVPHAGNRNVYCQGVSLSALCTRFR